MPIQCTETHTAPQPNASAHMHSILLNGRAVLQDDQGTMDLVFRHLSGRYFMNPPPWDIGDHETFLANLGVFIHEPGIFKYGVEIELRGSAGELVRTAVITQPDILGARHRGCLVYQGDSGYWQWRDAHQVGVIVCGGFMSDLAAARDFLATNKMVEFEGPGCHRPTGYVDVGNAGDHDC